MPRLSLLLLLGCVFLAHTCAAERFTLASSGDMDRLMRMIPYPSSCAAQPVPLVVGSSGDCVRAIQANMNRIAGDIVHTPDGVWREELTEDIHRYLESKGLGSTAPRGAPLPNHVLRLMYADHVIGFVLDFIESAREGAARGGETAAEDATTLQVLVELVTIMAKLPMSEKPYGVIGKPNFDLGHCGPQDSALLNMLVPDSWSVGVSNTPLSFGGACREHDVCYGSGEGETARLACDRAFLKDLQTACVKQMAGAPQEDMHRCELATRLYYQAVRTLGSGKMGSARNVALEL
eukprot:c27259_g1_i1.p1 GENE.c27259_g1_i1~~c27259_g1_i1.p1  ORF type:complete len:292 (+),score=52.87 c27259_g1_i1:79-954(+)